MSDIYTQLFLLREGGIIVYDCRELKNPQIQRRNGEDEQDFNAEDFWKWWFATCNFIPNRHFLDAILISDTSGIDFFPPDLKPPYKTRWDKTNIGIVARILFPNDYFEIKENGKIVAEQSRSFSDKIIYYLSRNAPITEQQDADSTDKAGITVATQALPPQEEQKACRASDGQSPLDAILSGPPPEEILKIIRRIH